MKLDILRKIIREEVKKGIKEELREVLTEAVKVAGTPSKDLKSTYVQKEPVKKTLPGNLDEMINLTKKSMTNEDYRTLVSANSSMVTGIPNTATTMANQMNINSGNQPGLDISNLDFVKKAKNVLDASNKINKNVLN